MVGLQNMPPLLLYQHTTLSHMESSVRNAANLTKVPPTLLRCSEGKGPTGWKTGWTFAFAMDGWNDTDPYLQPPTISSWPLHTPKGRHHRSKTRLYWFNKIHDFFGWDNLVEGRVARVPQTFKPVLISQQYIKHTSSWASGSHVSTPHSYSPATTMAIMHWNSLECSPFEYQTSIIIIPLIFLERNSIIKWKYISLKTTGWWNFHPRSPHRPWISKIKKHQNNRVGIASHPSSCSVHPAVDTQQ